LFWRHPNKKVNFCEESATHPHFSTSTLILQTSLTGIALPFAVLSYFSPQPLSSKSSASMSLETRMSSMPRQRIHYQASKEKAKASLLVWGISGSGSLSLSLICLLDLDFFLGDRSLDVREFSAAGSLSSFSFRDGCRLFLFPCHSLDCATNQGKGQIGLAGRRYLERARTGTASLTKQGSGWGF